jgi:hypothetical protein
MKWGQPLLPIVGELNVIFSHPEHHDLLRKASDFAPGKSLSRALADLIEPTHPTLTDVLSAHVDTFPGSIKESVRAAIYYALTSKPPIMITWAWQAAYDFELDVWEIVEPAPNLSGITLLIKSRYPEDPHPNAG